MNQEWTFHDSVDGTYTVVSAIRGKCLDVRGGSIYNGAALIQWTCNGQANQNWNIVSLYELNGSHGHAQP